MKKLIFPFILLLAGCGTSSPTNQTVTTHQSLQAIETANVDTSSLTASNNEVTSQITFETQQEFVDFMYERVRSLEDTLSLLNTNLTQVISESDESLHSEIRQNLLAQAQQEKALLSTLSLPNDEVKDLHNYVVLSYNYNIDDKAAQYDIVRANSLEERQELLEANSENERLGSLYLGLAWHELSRLSETQLNRK